MKRDRDLKQYFLQLFFIVLFGVPASAGEGSKYHHYGRDLIDNGIYDKDKLFSNNKYKNIA